MGQRTRRWRVAGRKALRRIVYSKSSAQSIAGGLALGVFVGLTPTFGFQMIPAAFLAALFRVNILAAVLAVWVTNPFTAVFIYGTEYYVGKLILPFESGSHAMEGLSLLADRIAEISMVDFGRTVGAVVDQFLLLGNEVISRLLLGSLVCASIGALVAYPSSLWAVKYVRRRRQARAIRKADMRFAELDAAGLVRHESQTDTDPTPGDDDSGELLPMEGHPPQIVSLPIKTDANGQSDDDASRKGKDTA